MIDLSIVIVSYNTRKFLKQCVTSIRLHPPGTFSYEIIVVDNASSDGSVEMMKSEKLKIVANKKNLGFAKANNQGVSVADGRYLLFLNPDTLVRKKTLETMVEFMDKNSDVGAATCRVELPDGVLDDACHRGFPTPWNAFCYFFGLSKLFPYLRVLSGYTLGWMDTSKLHTIDACAGAFMLVRKKAGDQVKWWDEDFFWYGEDLDFCYRLRERGWSIYFVPTVSILHYKGISGGIKEETKHLTTASQQTRKQATNARFEAMRLFYKKHYMDKYPRFVTKLVFSGINLKRLTAMLY